MARYIVTFFVLACATTSWAQTGQRASSVTFKDYNFPTYAQPWSVGPNVCAYLKDRLNSQIYTTCFPYEQEMLGKSTTFEYNCCPGYMEDPDYENYRGAWENNAPNSMKTNCLKKVPSESSVASELARLQVDNDVINYISKANVGSEPVTYFIETGPSFKTDKYNSVASTDSAGGHIVKGIHRINHLANGELLESLAGSNEKLKITRYSNGIICVDCARMVSVDHPAKNAVIHFVDRHIFNKKGESTAQVLESKYSYFWNSLPKELRTALSGNSCLKWYTVFVPSAELWNERTRGLSIPDTEKLAKAHIVASLICSGAIVKTSRTSRNLNDENLVIGATPDGGRWVRLGISKDQYTANFKKVEGEFEQVTSNGVIYEIDNLIEYSGIISVLQWPYVPEEWRNTLSSCIQLSPDKRYIFIVPSQRGLQWFLRSTKDFSFNDEESLFQFRQRYETNEEYRCYVAKYHVLEVADKKTSLNDFWSQFWLNKRGFYKSLAFQKTYKEYVNHLDLFMNQDDSSQLIWQYSYARDFRAYPVKEGHVYEIDYVNIPPDEKLMYFLERRQDLADFYKLMINPNHAVKLYAKRNPVQLILAFANNNFTEKKLKWDLEDFLALHWVDLYFWIGDLGYLSPGERTMVGSGLNSTNIFVYRTKTSNEYYVWWQKAGTSLSMEEARNRWVKIIYYNYWKLDSMVWILQAPLQCSEEICKIKLKLEISYFMGYGCDKILDEPTKRKIIVQYKKEIADHHEGFWKSPAYKKRFPDFQNSTCYGQFEIAFEPRTEPMSDE